MYSKEILNILTGKGLKITPQRIAVLDALHNLKNHPNTESIIDYIKKYHPNISTGTIYKTLETFSSRGIVAKVKTDRDVMRYDAIQEKHHHLYCMESEIIEDYFDEELDQLIEQYFKNKNIPRFEVKDFKLQILGYFTGNNENV